MKDNKQASEPTQECAHTPEWQRIFDMMQVTYHGGDPLENEVMKAQAIANYHAANVQDCMSAQDEQLATLTQQFTDYRKQAEKELQSARNFVIAAEQECSDCDKIQAERDSQAATIKQSGERIERLEALISEMFDWCKCGYVHNTRMPVDGGLAMLAKAKSIRDKKEVTSEDIRKWLH